MEGSQSKVFRALESTESLLASLLDRSSFSPTEPEYPIETTDGGSGYSSNVDVEQSLLGVGERMDTRDNFTVRQHGGLTSETLPDPRDTLTSIG